MSNEKPVELTEAERAELDVAGMFPTQFGWEHPEKWEKSTARSIGAKVGRIVASRVARIVAQGYVPVTEVAAREAAARREALLEAADEAAKQAEWIEMMRGQKAALAAKLAQTEDDLAAARAGVERLQDWKASASDVMLGLQDVGKALGLPLGESITGTLAAETAERLKDKVARVEALAEEWANDQGILSPDSRYTRNVLVHELRAALAEPERDEEGGR